VNNPEADVTRGAKAQALLQNEIYQDAWKNVRNAIHEKWELSPVRDLEGQQQLHLMLKLLNDLQSVFELAVTDGKEARRRLDDLHKPILTPKQWMNR
jgi:hypothetical protein